jgi:hypothetical protein
VFLTHGAQNSSPQWSLLLQADLVSGNTERMWARAAEMDASGLRVRCCFLFCGQC